MARRGAVVSVDRERVPAARAGRSLRAARRHHGHPGRPRRRRAASRGTTASSRFRTGRRSPRTDRGIGRGPCQPRPPKPVEDRHHIGLLGNTERLRRFVLVGAGKSRDVGAPPGWRQTFSAAASLRPRERADHRRRVEAATEGRRDRYVRAQPQCARLEEQLAKLLSLVVEIAWDCDEMVKRVPPAPPAHTLVAHLEPVPREQRLYAAKQDVLRCIARKPRTDRLGVLGRFEAVQSEKRLQLRCEREPTGLIEHVERLHAEAISGQEQASLPAIPDCDAPHAVEAHQAIRSPMLERREDHLGVALSPEANTTSLEQAPQFEKIVDLAVVGR